MPDGKELINIYEFHEFTLGLIRPVLEAKHLHIIPMLRMSTAFLLLPALLKTSDVHREKFTF
jgi:hypothetical protein